MTTKQKLAKLLKESREKSGMTQRILSEKLGFSSPQFISILELGKSNIPLKVLGKICKLFSLDEKEIAEILISDHRDIVLREMARGARELK